MVSLSFPAKQFGFLNLNSNQYTLFLIGENLSKTNIHFGLKSFDTNRDTAALNQLFEQEKVLSLGLIETKNLQELNQEVSILEQKIDFGKTHFAVLLKYKDPDVQRSQYNLPAEESFIISADKFTVYYKAEISTGLCYHFILQALESENRPEQIVTHQIGHPNHLPPLLKKQESAEVIMPHKGDLKDLESALWYLEKQKNAPQKISVCFDEFVSDAHFNMADDNTHARFFANSPAGVGPYPSRDVLARGTEEDVIIFHDSDDVSTSDRIAILANALKTSDADAVGSHELRVNKIDKKVEAIRFPLNVIDLEDKELWHYIFFPTTAISKTAYLKTGGLSTIRKHSSDSQFYWRAHFFLNIKNVDEFLYIRTKRANSLTTASATALGSTVRERLQIQWRADFLRIQNRNIGLLDSTLVDEYNVAKIKLIPLKKAFRQTILDWQSLNEILEKTTALNQLKKPSFPKESDILEERLLNYKEVKDPGVSQLKKSTSWKIGWAITRLIIFLLGWIPFVKRKI